MHHCFRFVRWFPVQTIYSVVAALLFFGSYPADAAGFKAGPSMGTPRSYHSATVLGNGKILITGGYGSGYLQTSELYDPANNSYSPAASLTSPRHYHTATPLPNGKVLIAGGSIDGTDFWATTELYDPASNTFAAGASMNVARNSHTATLLPNGKVLVAGGYNGLQSLAGAEIYDPATDTFSSTSNAMSTARQSHTATLLPNGTVLIAGGYAGSSALTSSEIYDPATNSFSSVSSMTTGRYYHTSTLLPNGRVLIAGGSSDSAILLSAELYDPATNTFSAAASLASRRYFHSANLLPNGKVLVAGGRNGSTFLNTAELYDPATNTFSTATNMLSARYLHASILLPNGKILVTGGSNVAGSLRYTEFYDSFASSFSTIQELTASRAGHAVVTLPSGKILIAGGNSGAGPTDSAEVFDPSINMSSPLGPLSAPRAFFTATLLPNGRVLIVGGESTAGPTASAELFDPVAGSFTPLPPIATPRSKHSATLLENGSVLIAGGLDGTTALLSTELFDPALNTFVPGASMATARQSHTATVLVNGKVLMAGGANSTAINGAELYDTSTRSFQVAANMTTPREGHTATLLPGGKVLVSGGANGTGFLNSAELYDPASGFSVTGVMVSQRQNHRAVLLHNGLVLLSGGRDAAGALQATEIFDPALNTFSAAAAMTSPREFHAAQLLPDGNVLIAGGSNATPIASAEIFTTVPEAAAGRRPAISTFSAPEGNPATLLISGSGFAGILESSGGATNNSPANLPLFQLQGINNDRMKFTLSDPLNSWTDTSFSSASFYGLPTGFYRARLVAGAIPSLEKVVRISPAATVAPSALDFSSVSTSRTSTAQTISIANSGSADLEVIEASITGTDAAMFALDSGAGCGINGILGYNLGCTLSLTFSPASTGTKEASLNLRTTDPDRPAVTIPLTGTGIIVTYPLTIVSTGSGAGSIALSTGGSCTGNCSESIVDGTTVTLSPLPDQNSLFAGWSGCDSVSGTDCSVTMSEAKTVTAAFSGTFPLTVRFPGSGSGTITLSTGGECTETCTRQILESTVVTLTAATGSSSYFAGWSGCDSVDGLTCTVSVNAGREIEVLFRPTYQLNVGVTGSGSGAVSLPSGGSCTGSCTETYNDGTSFSLTAVPEAGSYFASWTGCDSVNGTTCNVTMSSAHTVTASFAVTPVLSVGFTGTGTGTVTMSPGDTCTGDCIRTYATGTQVSLTPAVAAGSLFSGWTGCDYTTGNVCYVTMNTSKSVNAIFTAGFTLAVGVTGSGTVTLDPGGTCGGTCSQQYSTGTTVTLTPSPIGAGTFTGWTGCDSVSGTICTVTMTSAKNVAAAFTSSYPLYLVVSGLGSGSFDFSTGDSCTGSCNRTFNGGAPITITPQLSPGSIFDGWTGCDVVIGDTCTVSMTGGRDVTASVGLTINISGRMYGGLQEAYDSITSGEEMLLRTYDFAGDLDCNKSVAVLITGGYERSFTDMTGQSTMQGMLTISRGSVVIDNLVIR